MDIKTKFKIYDTVWVMMNNVPVNRAIKGITINVSEHGLKINYMLEATLHEESKVFATKAELLESL